jgi:hypothetical protein
VAFGPGEHKDWLRGSQPKARRRSRSREAARITRQSEEKPMKKLCFCTAALALVGSLADTAAAAQKTPQYHDSMYAQTGEVFFSLHEDARGPTSVNVGVFDLGGCVFEANEDIDILRLSEKDSRIRVVIDLEEFPTVWCQGNMTQPVFVAVKCRPNGLYAQHNEGTNTVTQRINGETVTTKMYADARVRSVECSLEIDDQFYEDLIGSVGSLREKSKTRMR